MYRYESAGTVPGLPTTPPNCNQMQLPARTTGLDVEPARVAMPRNQGAAPVTP